MSKQNRASQNVMVVGGNEREHFGEHMHAGSILDQRINLVMYLNKAQIFKIFHPPKVSHRQNLLNNLPHSDALPD
jgi:hypothetical protein